MSGSALRKPLMRIPYTDVFASPRIFPVTAKTTNGAVEALLEFLAAPSADGPSTATCLTGAGLSVASGLADYRGDKGTYRVNKSYRPIYHHEFLASHAARRRYWARSFLGWTSLKKARPNAAHRAIADLAKMGVVSSVVTQNVDGLHHAACEGLADASGRPDIVELHGYLRALVCTTCKSEYPRDLFQENLARLNPAWAAFLEEAVASGALGTEDPAERRAKGIRSNPDGDVDLPDAPYTTFRYPACPTCLAHPPPLSNGEVAKVVVDKDGAWESPSNAGILKPAVVMFGESIAGSVKAAAEEAVTGADKLIVLGTSLATYSAWRLAKLARDKGKPIAIVNMGGVRGEDAFFVEIDHQQTGAEGVRVEMPTEVILPALVEALGRTSIGATSNVQPGYDHQGSAVFKDMLS
ncbi:hypothetical protein PspLS_00324 [Pyricularia sp. CBS 133598]|nr:hypothetical protein PspLS_00324 [Pyricularia sp. CBS 133598]